MWAHTAKSTELIGQKLEPVLQSASTWRHHWGHTLSPANAGLREPGTQASVSTGAQLPSQHSISRCIPKQKGQGDSGYGWSHSLVLNVGKLRPMEGKCSPRSHSQWATKWRLKLMFPALSQGFLVSLMSFLITKEDRITVAIKQGVP